VTTSSLHDLAFRLMSNGEEAFAARVAEPPARAIERDPFLRSPTTTRGAPLL
jgi:hypothetical protein